MHEQQSGRRRSRLIRSEFQMKMPELPEDVVMEVLLALPIQSLIRFTSVSKSWKSLINSNEFAKLHQDRSSSCSTSKFIWFQEDIMDTDYIMQKCCKVYGVKDTDQSREEKKQQQLKVVKFNYSLETNEEVWEERCIIDGSIKGLLCLHDSPFQVLLWNPLTNKQWFLPDSPIDNPKFKSCLVYSVFYGFGYDESTDDYKIVRVMKFLDVLNLPIYQEVKLYSLKSNSWKNLPVPGEHNLTLLLGVVLLLGCQLTIPCTGSCPIEIIPVAIPVLPTVQTSS